MLNTLLLLALGTTPAPMAVDYVLNVPIRIENMRNVTSARVSCDIAHIGATPMDHQVLTTPGTGYADVTVVDGAFNGTVTATVSVSATSAIEHPPTTWTCMLIFLWRNPDGSTISESFRSTAERVTAYTRLTGQAVAESTIEISGPLP